MSLSEANFTRTVEEWNINGREDRLEPMFGWLATSLPCYPETINLKTMVHTRRIEIRPYIELEPTDHPLAVEQRVGISLKRVQNIAEEVCKINNQL